MQLILLASLDLLLTPLFQETLPHESQQQKILQIPPVLLAVTITLFNLHSRISIMPYFKTCFSLLIAGGETIQSSTAQLEEL